MDVTPILLDYTRNVWRRPLTYIKGRVIWLGCLGHLLFPLHLPQSRGKMWGRREVEERRGGDDDAFLIQLVYVRNVGRRREEKKVRRMCAGRKA